MRRPRTLSPSPIPSYSLSRLLLHHAPEPVQRLLYPTPVRRRCHRPRRAARIRIGSDRAGFGRRRRRPCVGVIYGRTRIAVWAHVLSQAQKARVTEVIGQAARRNRRRLRIPMKKIIHSELMTITAWPGDAVESIVEQVIVMGQEGGGNRAALFRFCRFWLRWSRKVCLSTPLGIHLFDARREISPVVQIEFHGGGLLDDVREVMQAGQRRAALVIE